MTDRREYMRAWAAANMDRVKAKRAAWRAANLDHVRARNREAMRARRAADPEKERAAKRASYALNRDAEVARQKASRDSRREELRQYHRDWYAANQAKSVEKARRRTAIKRNTSVERVDYEEIVSAANGLCGICRKSLDLFGTHIDHIVPLSKGGTHTKGNLQATHAWCNQSKGAKIQTLNGLERSLVTNR